MASPFQAATTLSSRAGRVRVARAASSRARTSDSHRSGSSGSASSCSVDGAVLERARLGDLEQLGGPGAVVLAEHLGELGRRPGVELALDALGVGVERGGEPALVGAQLAQQEVGGLAARPARPAGRRSAATSARRPEQQRVVVEHLLEVRHHPAAVHGVAREAAGRAGRTCRRGPSPRRVRSSHPGARSATRSAPRCRSRNSSTIDGGNFGAPPKPPCAASNSPASARTAPSSRSASSGSSPASATSLPQVTAATLGGHACVPRRAGSSRPPTIASSTCRNDGWPCRGWSGK